MRRKALWVVAQWKLDILALAKKVSGHQIRPSISLLIHSSSSPDRLKLSRASSPVTLNNLDLEKSGPVLRQSVILSDYKVVKTSPLRHDRLRSIATCDLE